MTGPAIHHPTEDIHGYLGYAPFTLAGLLALAVLGHYLYPHDGVLARMWPEANNRSPTDFTEP
jgi:cytochrome b561